MTRSFDTPQAFRNALDDRLRNESKKRSLPVETLRTKLLIERLLARLFASRDAPWLLKGGYAFELRYRPRARTTRDIDLCVHDEAGTESGDIEWLREELQEAAELELGDFLQFQIAAPRGTLRGPPRGGATFPIVVRLSGKEFGRFQIDAGFGDPLFGVPEDLVGDDLVAFAGLEPARVRAIPRTQQFAEKIHAYTHPWTDRENTRVKDLVDLLILIERGNLDHDELRAALRATFETRKRHGLPTELPLPPHGWKDEFAALSQEVGFASPELGTAFTRLSAFWSQVVSPGFTS